MIKIYLLGINIILFTFLNCASYKYSVTESKIPISFGIDNFTQGKSRDFVIEAKISWFLFDLINIEEFDLSQTLNANLPNAKSIHSLRIVSKENGVDSVIRLISTGAQVLAFVSNRPLLFSRRTILITGTVIE